MLYYMPMMQWYYSFSCNRLHALHWPFSLLHIHAHFQQGTSELNEPNNNNITAAIMLNTSQHTFLQNQFFLHTNYGSLPLKWPKSLSTKPVLDHVVKRYLSVVIELNVMQPTQILVVIWLKKFCKQWMCRQTACHQLSTFPYQHGKITLFRVHRKLKGQNSRTFKDLKLQFSSIKVSIKRHISLPLNPARGFGGAL